MPEFPVSTVFQSILENQRDTINSQVRMRLKRGVKFEPADLMQHLRDGVGPIVDAVHDVMPERASTAARELISISLELLEACQLGSESRSPRMLTLWKELLPRIPKLIARDPRRVLGSLCNGLLFVEKHGEPAARRWLEHFREVGPMASDPEQLLSAGKFAAWVSGLAQYRLSALSEADKLPTTIVAKLLQSPHLSEEEIKQTLEAFQTNPWVSVSTAAAKQRTKGSYELIRCCAFRGYGGSILAPPRVFFINGRWIVSDGIETGVLFADRFGWTVVRENIDKNLLKASRAKSPRVSDDGHVAWDGLHFEDANLVGPTSQAFDGRTLAVTTQTSFHVYLLVKEVDS